MPTELTDWNSWLNEANGKPPQPSSVPPVTKQETDWNSWLNESPQAQQAEPSPEPQDAITSDPMAVGGLLQVGGGQNTGAAIPPSPQETPRGAMTPFYATEKALSGDYGESVQRSFVRAKKAVNSGRGRFQWSGLVADTPPEERNDTLLAISQLSAQRGEYADDGTLSKVGTALVRGASQFKTSIDNTLGELVEGVFGKTKIPGIEVVDGWGDSERLFEKAAESAAEQGDPLVNPNDPFWKRWTVQAAEMTPAMAAGAVTANPYLAAGVWFAPIYDDARDELLSAGVDPTTARVGGAISAAVQAAAETFNLNPFKPKGAKDPVTRGIREHVKNYLVGWTKELSEEFIQGGVQGATMAAATALDEQAPDLALGDQLRQKMGDAIQAGGPLAVMMLPGFIGGLPASRRESVARRWMANNPQERVERVAEKAAEGKPISRSDVPEVKDAAGRAALGEEVAKAKPRYRWNPKTGKLEPKIADSKIQPGPLADTPNTLPSEDIKPPAPGFGRPELANPGMTQEARDAIDAIDQGRKEAGVPETLPNAVVEERATELIQNDYEGQVSRILNNREEPNPEVSEVARQLINTESEKAMNGDVDAWERRSELGHALRERRTDVARELQIGYDRILGPKERQQHVKTSATELPEKLQNKIDKLAAPERKLRKRSIDADIAIDDAWKRLGAAFGGNLGSNLGNLPEAAKAAGDLVVAYARKGVYVIEDIIADLEANRGQKLGAQVRQQLRDAATSRKDEIRVARVENENAQSDASRKKRERNQKKIKAELSKHAEKMQRWKDDLKRLPGWEIDVDKPEGLSVVEADVALQYLQAFIGGNFKKFLEWMRFVMLSALDSQFVNAVGNAENLTVIFGGRYPLEWLTAAARGQANVHEFMGTYRALLNPKNLLRSAHNGWRAFKTESDIYEVEQAARPKSSAADYHGNGLYIRGRKGRVLRAVGGQRGLLAMDNVAKSFISDAFVTMYANRVAVQEGFNPKTEPQAYDERVQQLIDNHESQAWKLATDAVHEATLQEKGWVLKRVLEAANDGPGQAIRLFLPFITTPWNVPKFVLRHTPGIGTAMLAADIYRGDKAAINRDIAAQIMGFIGMAWFAAYNDPHDEDKWLRFTGTENASYRRKNLVSASKHKPYHMYLFGQPVDLRRFDPIATWIAVAVDTTQALKGAETADDYTQAVKAYTTSVAKAMRDKTWLQTISDMIELFTRLSQDDGSGESFNRVVEWAAKFSSDRLVPNLWRSISRDMDAYQKDTRLHGKGEQRQERLKDVLRIRAGFDTADDEIVYDLWSYPMSMRDLDDAPVTNMPWRILDFALRQVSALPMASQPPFIGTDILMQWNIENPNDPYWPGEPGLKWSNADGEQVQMTPEQKAQFLRLSGLYARYKVQAWADAGKFNDIDKLTTKDRDKIKQYITEGRSKARRSLSARWRKGETPTDDEIMNLYWFPDSTEAD